MSVSTELEPTVQINVRKVLADKNPALARWIPNFVLRWLEKTIHQDDINRGLIESRGYKDNAFAQWCLDFLKAKAYVKGTENIPLKGGVILASNHPLGGLDGIAFMAEVGKIRPDYKFIVNDILTRIPNFENTVIGVDKHGPNSKQLLSRIDELYASEEAVLIFPAGLCSRKMENDVIEDLRWNKSFITKATKYSRDIVPVFSSGKNSDWFYNLARWRKRLGLKANLEMLYLPDELFKQKGKSMTLTFGKPISYKTFDNRFKPEEWAEWMRRFVYTLENNPEADFESFVNRATN